MSKIEKRAFIHSQRSLKAYRILSLLIFTSINPVFFWGCTAGSEDSQINKQAESPRPALERNDRIQQANIDTPTPEERDREVIRKTNTETIEIIGEVIDTWCYCSGVMGAGRGAEHENCARLCVAGGVTAGILDDDGQVYIAAKYQGYKGCAGLLLPYVAKRVKVTGWLAERGGVKLLKIKSVQELEAPSTE